MKFVEYARKCLPNAIHYLYTNGILLNAEKFSALVKNLDVLIIDNYDDNFQLIPSVEKTLSTAPAPYDMSSAKVVPYLAAYARLSDSECDVRVDLRKKISCSKIRRALLPTNLTSRINFVRLRRVFTRSSR